MQQFCVNVGICTACANCTMIAKAPSTKYLTGSKYLDISHHCAVCVPARNFMCNCRVSNEGLHFCNAKLQPIFFPAVETQNAKTHLKTIGCNHESVHGKNVMGPPTTPDHAPRVPLIKDN